MPLIKSHSLNINIKNQNQVPFICQSWIPNHLKTYPSVFYLHLNHQRSMCLHPQPRVNLDSHSHQSKLLTKMKKLNPLTNHWLSHYQVLISILQWPVSFHMNVHHLMLGPSSPLSCVSPWTPHRLVSFLSTYINLYQ